MLTERVLRFGITPQPDENDEEYPNISPKGDVTPVYSLSASISPGSKPPLASILAEYHIYPHPKTKLLYIPDIPSEPQWIKDSFRLTEHKASGLATALKTLKQYLTKTSWLDRWRTNDQGRDAEVRQMAEKYGQATVAEYEQDNQLRLNNITSVHLAQSIISKVLSRERPSYCPDAPAFIDELSRHLIEATTPGIRFSITDPSYSTMTIKGRLRIVRITELSAATTLWALAPPTAPHYKLLVT